MSEELKPCPFCGGKAEAYRGIWARRQFEAHCCECRSGGPYRKDRIDYAIKAWNHRPEEERLQKRIEELERIARAFIDMPIDDMPVFIQRYYRWTEEATDLLKGADHEF